MKKSANCFLQPSSFGFFKMDKNKGAWLRLACKNIFRKLTMTSRNCCNHIYLSARRPRDRTKTGWCSSPVIQGSATVNARCKPEVKHSCVYGEKLTYFVNNVWGWHFRHLKMAAVCPQESMIENEDENEGEPLLLRSQTDFRHGRDEQHTNRCIASMLNVFKIFFCSLGLWGHQLWNYIPRVLFMLVCIFQTIYRFFINFGCVDFDCHFMQNSTSEAKTQVHKGDVSTGNAVFSMASFAADLSYVILVCSFVVAKRMDSTLVAPSETLTKDLNSTDVTLLSFAFIFISTSLLCLAVSFYLLPPSNEMRNPTFLLPKSRGQRGKYWFIGHLSIPVTFSQLVLQL